MGRMEEMSIHFGKFDSAEEMIKALKSRPEKSKIIDILIAVTAIYGTWEKDFTIKESQFTEFLNQLADEILEHVNENYIKK